VEKKGLCSPTNGRAQRRGKGVRENESEVSKTISVAPGALGGEREESIATRKRHVEKGCGGARVFLEMKKIKKGGGPLGKKFTWGGGVSAFGVTAPILGIPIEHREHV